MMKALMSIQAKCLSCRSEIRVSSGCIHRITGVLRTPASRVIGWVDIRFQDVKFGQQLLPEQQDDILRTLGVLLPRVENMTFEEVDRAVCLPVRRSNEKGKKIIWKEIQQMLKDDIIKPFNFAYRSPMLLVRNANGTLCMAIDYKRLKPANNC
eukprot:GHVP01001750.1.p1 GENE.GHVP01001750.1~~GHVP01001750.1.p1  ORF type:complete len:153 (-),score=7.69 GHVP01001750.1:241-699(-)